MTFDHMSLKRDIHLITDEQINMFIRLSTEYEDDFDPEVVRICNEEIQRRMDDDQAASERATHP